MDSIWTIVRAERDALIRDLESVPADRWATPSLCPGWDVHDVLAHLVDDAKTTKPGFILSMLRARFNFDRLNEDGIARERAADPLDTLGAFRAVRDRTTSAPAPLATRLVEIIVHGEDIRRPLGIKHDYPVDAAATALRYQLGTSVKMGGGKERAEGLHLVATDSDVDTGEGQDVHGTTLALLLAVSGRPVSAQEVTGAGASKLNAIQD